MAMTHSPHFEAIHIAHMHSAGNALASIFTHGNVGTLVCPDQFAFVPTLVGQGHVNLSAPSTTWALVMTAKSLLRMTTPQSLRFYSPPLRRATRVLLREQEYQRSGRKNSTHPLVGPSPSPSADTRWVVRMPTTDGPTCSTSSVKSGKPFTSRCRPGC